MESLKLAVPEQHEYSDPTVERNAARLHARLTNLPLMDVVETVRQVLNALEALNEQRLDTDLRHELLDIFRDTAHRLFVTVDPLHLRQLALSRAQRDQAIHGVERLLLGMAGGYKIIIRDCHESGTMQSAGRRLGLAVNRALEQTSYVLLDCYRFYRSVNEAVFSELHQLYRIARHYGLLDTVADAEVDGEPPLSTAALYHATLLLSLTDPFRLAEGEVALLYDVLKQHAEKCRVIPGNSWPATPEGLFFIDLNSNRPPESCVHLTVPASVLEPYLLDARAALASVRERLGRTPAKVRQQSPEAMVLRRLLPEEPDPLGTRAARHPDSRWIRLLPGLDNIHAWLLSSTGTAAATGAAVAGRQPQEPLSCRVVDTSAGGMKLAWDDGGAGDARVGDLLGLVEEGHRLRLAVIRSVRVFREGGMETGIQLVRGATAAVYCRDPDHEEDPARQALFLPADEEAGVSATLVTASGYYSRGRRLLIDVSGREISACAGRCVVDGPVFERFEFFADGNDD